MKKIINILLLFVLTLLLSCRSTAQDNESSNSETNMTLLIDCTSTSLYDEIEHDIRINIPNYLQTTGVTNISYLQKFCMRVGFIEATCNLSLTQESISLPEKKKVSNNRAAELKNPQPILQMIGNQLTVGKSIASNKQNRSPIVDVILKSMREMHPESQEIILIFSDGVEYSDAANFYKSIPFSDEAFEKYYAKLDPFIIQEATSKIASTQPTVVFYLKTSEEGINKANLKHFYSKFFEKIGVTNYMFLDNLTQNVQSFNID